MSAAWQAVKQGNSMDAIRHVCKGIIALLLCAGSGCASIGVKTASLPPNPTDPRYIYAGVQVDLTCMAYGAGTLILGKGMTTGPRPFGLLFISLGLIDMPFSFAADTLLLPYDVYITTLGGKTRRGLEDSMARQANTERTIPAEMREHPAATEPAPTSPPPLLSAPFQAAGTHSANSSR